MRYKQIRVTDLFKLAELGGAVTIKRRIRDYIANQGLQVSRF